MGIKTMSGAAAMQRMVVLANSRKCGGYCLAGKALDLAGRVGGWVRPVTGCAADGLPRQRTLCSDGRQAAVLDVVSLEWGRSEPHLHQRENCLIGPAVLERCGRVLWDDLSLLADRAPTGLWINGHSTHGGLNDRVPVPALSGLHGSLYLVAVHELVLYSRPGHGNQQMTFRADFCIGQQRYNLALTDTVATFWLQTVQRLELADAYLCVSLAVPFRDGFVYKLATAVITKGRAGSVV